MDYKSIEIQSTHLQPNNLLIYLGATSQIDGDQTTQTKVLKQQVDQLAKQLVSTSMQHYYANTFQQCSLNPKVVYPLV